MKNQIVGYIVTTEYFHGEPLRLCTYEPYPWPVLLRGDMVTIFKTKKAASAAIDKTIEWARIRENEDENLRPLEWADKNRYKIMEVRGEQAGTPMDVSGVNEARELARKLELEHAASKSSLSLLDYLRQSMTDEQIYAAYGQWIFGGPKAH